MRKLFNFLKNEKKYLVVNGGIIYCIAVYPDHKTVNPTPIQISVEGSDVQFSNVPVLFNLMDCVILVIFAFILGITTMYLVLAEARTDRKIEEKGMEEQKRWEHTMKTLKDDEKTTYETIFLEDGLMYQSDLVKETGFSHAKVTRCLDALENRGLLERRRKGMGNIVLLR